MFGLHLLLLLTFWSIPVDAYDTSFHVTGSLKCGYDFALDQNFVLDVRVIEQDFWPFDWFDDDITWGESLKLTRRTKENSYYWDDKWSPRTFDFTVDAEDHGDGIGLEYEVYIAIQHTCTSDRQPAWRYHTIKKKMPIKDGAIYIGTPLINLTSSKKREAREVEEKNDSDEKEVENV